MGLDELGRDGVLLDGQHDWVEAFCVSHLDVGAGGPRQSDQFSAAVRVVGVGFLDQDILAGFDEGPGGGKVISRGHGDHGGVGQWNGCANIRQRGALALPGQFPGGVGVDIHHAGQRGAVHLA